MAIDCAPTTMAMNGLSMERMHLRHETSLGEVWVGEIERTPGAPSEKVALKVVHLARVAQKYDELLQLRAGNQSHVAEAYRVLIDPTDDQIWRADDPRNEFEVFQRLQQIPERNPSVVEYISAMFTNESYYFLMEWCDGGDLFEYAEKWQTAKMPETYALAVISHVASALEFLHRHGIAHRDVSLENIMFHGDRCKLGDFGLATFVDRPCQDRVGKFNYMASEVVRADAPYDPTAADMWSLGIVLFILLTGSPLVNVATSADPCFRSLESLGALVFEKFVLEIHEDTRDLLASLLQIDPQKRLTARQVLEHPAMHSVMKGVQ